MVSGVYLVSFEWRTVDEGEAVWQEDARLPEGSRHRRPYVLLLVGLALAVAVGFVLWQQGRQRVAAAMAQVEADVRSSYALGRRSAENGDRELFLSVLSGRDPRWTDAQTAMLEEGLLFEKAAGLFGLQPIPGELEIITATVAPDLQEVVLVSERRFKAGGQGETPRLRRHLFFRKGAHRWLLSPPERAIWGAWQRQEGRHLTMIYPAREEALALRLLADLDETLAGVCNGLRELSCPPAFKLNIRFQTEPESVLGLNDGALTLAGDRWLNLPTPSLIGQPANEPAYRALRRGYAAAVATAAIAALAEYDCCEHRLFMQAVIDWQLSELGIQPWPLTLERYILVTDFLDRSTQLRQLWYRSRLAGTSEAERWQAHTLVELLLSEDDGASSAVALEEGLVQAGDVVDWLRLTTDYADLSVLYDAWRPLLFARIHALQKEHPLPSEDLLLACRTKDTFEIHRYKPSAEEWSPVPLEDGDYYILVPLPGDESVVLSGWQGAGPNEPTVLWEAGRRIPLRHPGPDRYFIPAVPLAAARIIDPRGQYLASWVAEPGNLTSELVLLDLDSCRNGDCRWMPAPAIPRWSPDGARLLAARNDTIWLAARGAVPHVIAQGHSPFWLNTTTFGYLSDGQLILSRVGGRQEVAVDLDTLLSEVTAGDSPTINHVMAELEGGNGLILFGDSVRSGESVLFLLQRPEGGADWFDQPPERSDVTVLLRTPDTVFGPLLSSFSPDGRWLTVQEAGEGWTRGEFLVYDLLRRRLVASPRKSRLTFSGYFPAQNYDWTADGRWLARWADGYIDLIAPEEGPYRRFVTLPPSLADSRNCPSLAWISGMER